MNGYERRKFPINSFTSHIQISFPKFIWIYVHNIYEATSYYQQISSLRQKCTSTCLTKFGGSSFTVSGWSSQLTSLNLSLFSDLITITRHKSSASFTVKLCSTEFTKRPGWIGLWATWSSERYGRGGWN